MHVPECTKFKALGGCRFGDRCACKHTAKPADERQNSASFAFHVPSNDKRQMHIRKILSDDKTQYSSYEHIRAQRKKVGPTLGVIQTGSQNQRHPNSPTFEERSFECTLSMEEIARTATWILDKNVYKASGSYSENRNRFFKPSAAGNVSSPSRSASKRDRSHGGLGSTTSYEE